MCYHNNRKIGSRGENMSFKKLLFTLFVAFTAIFTSMLGVSYAYYVVNGAPNITVTTGNIDTGMAVVFEQSQYLNVNTGVPINASDVDTKTSASVFTITPDANILDDSDVAINISLVNFSVHDALRVADLKYKLTCVGSVSGSDNTSVEFTGSGSDFSDSVISSGVLNIGTLKYSKGDINNNLDINRTYVCSFRVWLQESNLDQNNLMNRNFSGLFKINTLFKK